VRHGRVWTRHVCRAGFGSIDTPRHAVRVVRRTPLSWTTCTTTCTTRLSRTTKRQFRLKRRGRRTKLSSRLTRIDHCVYIYVVLKSGTRKASVVIVTQTRTTTLLNQNRGEGVHGRRGMVVPTRWRSIADRRNRFKVIRLPGEGTCIFRPRASPGVYSHKTTFSPFASVET